jgi:DNA polymerase-3 subunit alpha
MDDHEGVRLSGIIQNTKVIKTKKGDLMAFISVEDMQGSFEAIVFSSLYTSVSDLLSEDAPILIEGQIQKDENTSKVLASKIVPINMAEETWTVSLHFNLDISDTDRPLLEHLCSIFKNHPGTCDTYIHLKGTENVEAVIALPETLKLKPSDALKRDVTAVAGDHVIESVCSQAGKTRQL